MKITRNWKKLWRKNQKIKWGFNKNRFIIKGAQKISRKRNIRVWKFLWNEADKNLSNAKFNFWFMIGAIFTTFLLTIFFLQEIKFIENCKNDFLKIY